MRFCHADPWEARWIGMTPRHTLSAAFYHGIRSLRCWYPRCGKTIAGRAISEAPRHSNAMVKTHAVGVAADLKVTKGLCGPISTRLVGHRCGQDGYRTIFGGRERWVAARSGSHVYVCDNRIFLKLMRSGKRNPRSWIGLHHQVGQRRSRQSPTSCGEKISGHR